MSELIESSGALVWFLMPIGLVGLSTALIALGLSIATRYFRTAIVLASVVVGLSLVSLAAGVVYRISAQRAGFKTVAMVPREERNGILYSVERESKGAVKLAALVALPLLLFASATVAVAFGRTRGVT
jgi:hypothetical protein